jgi:hypothetical protein
VPSKRGPTAEGLGQETVVIGYRPHGIANPPHPYSADQGSFLRNLFRAVHVGAEGGGDCYCAVRVLVEFQDGDEDSGAGDYCVV